VTSRKKLNQTSQKPTWLQQNAVNRKWQTAVHWLININMISIGVKYRN